MFIITIRSGQVIVSLLPIGILLIIANSSILNFGGIQFKLSQISILISILVVILPPSLVLNSVPPSLSFLVPGNPVDFGRFLQIAQFGVPMRQISFLLQSLFDIIGTEQLIKPIVRGLLGHIIKIIIKIMS